MKLTSDVGVNFIPPGITHHDKIYLIGSCFTEHIAHKLQEAGFHVKHNVHGIIYNPVSIRQSLEDVLENKQYTSNDLFFYQGLWHSFRHHGNFSGADSGVVCQKINNSIARHREFLQQAGHVFITLGTSWLYKHKSSKQIVANCHKVPGYEFEKVLINVEEEAVLWMGLIHKLQKFSPNITVHFTISPVKHLRDGFFENNLSKGLLHLLIYQLMQRKKELRYFPSYEIMQDELRDYRFYDRDLAHPNAIAIDCIWEKFRQAYFAKPTKEICDEVMQVRKLFEHRIIHDTIEAKDFETKRNQYVTQLISKFPFIEFRLDL